ncbi:MAG: diadenylate cyclase CdaA [Lentisphaeria bacterium]|nr:diadenylate cyclase CdaA [Lentisphaeria bacterium]
MSTLWSLLCDWRLFLEVALLFFVIYTVFYFLRNTQGSLVMEGFLLLTLLLNAVARLLNLEIIADILELLSGSLLLFILILLQPELRRGMAHLGNLLTFETRRRRDTIDEIVHAVENMAKRKCGALIVIECKMRLQPLIDDAIQLDSKVNSQLLESIFFPNSPLHDGAVIIRDDRIVAARAILPLTRTENFSQQVGTRHRAAQGIAEESDSVTLLVSEESGSISIAHAGKLHRDLSPDMIYKMLDTLVVKKDAGEMNEIVIQLSEEEGNGELQSTAQCQCAGRKEEK